MRFASSTIAYKEERLIKPFLNHLPDWIEDKLVLNSTVPWQGETVPDATGDIAENLGATVIRSEWATEHDQRNAGQDYLYDYDWIITMDPDEFFEPETWGTLKGFLEREASRDAYVTGGQLTYWKRGFVVDPPEDYKQIVAVRPSVRFIDKRVVDTFWDHAPTTLHHMSWARTNEEIWNKITHYGHAHEFDTKGWYDNIWSSNQTENLHPLTPPSLRRVIPATLPESLKGLNLWP